MCALAKNTPKKEEEHSQHSRKYRLLVNRRLSLIAGISLLLFTFYLLLAFISYLFTAKADQSVVEAIDQTGIIEAGDEVQNWMGVYGAWLAYRFIFRWIGLGAFALIPLLLYFSLHWLLHIRLFNLGRILPLAIFFSFWISYVLGYWSVVLPVGSPVGLIAGGLGHQLARWTYALIGWGTPLWLLFCLLIFVVYYWNITSVEDLARLPKRQSFSRLLRNMSYAAAKHDDGGTVVEESQQANETTQAFMEKTAFDEQGRKIKIYDNKQQVDAELEKMGVRVVKLEPDGPAANHASMQREQLSKSTSNAEDVTEQTTTANTQTRSADSHSPAPQVEITLQDPLPQSSVEITEDTSEPNKDGATAKTSAPYDPRLDLSAYQMPPTSLLKLPPPAHVQVTREELEANKDRIVETLGHYGIGIDSIQATIGPTVTLYEIVPKAGVRISKIKNLEDDIALSLAALGIRIIAPIPGKGTIGIEVPNKQRELVALRSILESDKFCHTRYDLPIAFGKTISNDIFMIDLAKMPHLLIAGATGQGKSVGLNVILTCLLYKKHPAELKFVLVDPKKVELTLYNKIERHFLAKLPDEQEAIITDTSKVIHTLNSLCAEMDNRYELLKKAACRNIKEYNQKFLDRQLNPNNGHRFLPYIVLIIDELADLMMTAGKEVEQPIARLAQLARAIGIHLVVATQRPSVNVITGIIKANFPARVSFRVTSKVDSRTILDEGGAEQLIGMGDMLFSAGADLVRVQCAFVDTPEVDALCQFIAAQQGYPSAYLLPECVGEDAAGQAAGLDPSERDPLFEEAARIIVMHQQGSTSLLQRRLKIGYNRAGRLIDQLEQAGIVGPFEGSKAREVLISDEYALEQLLNELNQKYK